MRRGLAMRLVLAAVVTAFGLSMAGSASSNSVATYTMTVHVSGSGYVSSPQGGITNCRSTCAASYSANYTVRAYADGGWQFDHWGGACAGANATCDVNNNANKDTTAVFIQIPHTFTVGVSPAGGGSVRTDGGEINCPGTCSASISGDFWVRAYAAEGYKFTSWSGACAGADASCQVNNTTDKSTTANFTKLPPDPPASASVAGTTTTTASLSWAAARYATSYTMYLNGTQVATGVTGTSYTFTGLKCNTNYTYGVAANNDVAGPTAQASASGATAPCQVTVPAAPTGLAPQYVSDSSASLSWNASPGATGYHVYVDGASQGTVSGTSAPLTIQCSPRGHTLSVDAYNSAGTSAQTSVPFTLICHTGPPVQPHVPAAPTITGTSASGTSITLTWASITEATGYRVFLDGNAVTTSGSTSYEFGGLHCDSTHTVAVESYNDIGPSQSRASTTASTGACPPAPGGGGGSGGGGGGGGGAQLQTAGGGSSNDAPTTVPDTGKGKKGNDKPKGPNKSAKPQVIAAHASWHWDDNSKLNLLRVVGVPTGASVVFACSGGGCDFQEPFVARAATATSLKGIGKPLTPKSVLSIRITKPGMVGVLKKVALGTNKVTTCALRNGIALGCRTKSASK